LLAARQRLAAADLRHTLSLWPEMPHVRPLFLGLLAEAELALDEVARFLVG
jgi:hypothetical protein